MRPVGDATLQEIGMQKQLKLLIVADQRRSRQSLRALLATWPAVAAIREAENGAEALRLAEDYQPDLVLIDGCMAEAGGFEITQRIKQRWLGIGVVFLSMYSNLRNSAMMAGADAFVTKGEPPELLLRVLEEIAERRQD